MFLTIIQIIQIIHLIKSWEIETKLSSLYTEKLKILTLLPDLHFLSKLAYKNMNI